MNFSDWCAGDGRDEERQISEIIKTIQLYNEHASSVQRKKRRLTSMVI